MIGKAQIIDLLNILGYKDEGNNVYSQSFSSGCSVKVDVGAESFIYPESLGFKINDRTTCNFAKDENFVVFECITRLLKKGYRPEHLELEKRWNLGHDAKGGKADICVYETNGSDLLCIIECKTYGNEFDKELKNIKEDGGQLFSYWQQELSTKWLVLYASDIIDGKVEYKTETISCKDDANILEIQKNDPSVKIFKNANRVDELFEVWDETYQKAFQGDVMFNDDCVAYYVESRKLRKKDLIDFGTDDKIVNKFEEILRHNNVSDKENAFNRLVALFICKLADEINKKPDDVVDFQYKVGTDTYETLQDRLQKLHQEGMDEFMKEKIIYIADDYAEKIVEQYTGQKRERLVEELNKTLRVLKFYTNNDFAFKDVHNEELFYQNGKILVEVVQLFQNYRIIESNSLQLLGDLFEQLLNKGFKQNEGQFFTPMPITRFIWESLPIEEILFGSGNRTVYPKVIDYACGAGHFLTEGYESVNARLISNGVTPKDNWPLDKLYGIEKDYRLARVSKISLFMHGAGSGNIVFGDGLENYDEKSISKESFDVLVANPPYSVSGFKPHLKIKNNKLEILDSISNDGSEIETLFVERIAQLVKPNRFAAVVLPATILSKDNESFVKAREFLLRNFNIISIVSFGSKMFGATGTPTIVLFLRKFNEPPKRIDVVVDSVNAIFSSSLSPQMEDRQIVESYLDRISCEESYYSDFIEEKLSYLDFANSEYFARYYNDFIKCTEYKNKTKQVSFKKLNATDQNDILTKMFYKKYKDVEREKVLYFALTYNQKTSVVISPNDNDEQEKFLGYKWSNRKGSEGIQIFKLGGKLFNGKDPNDENNVSGLIKNCFKGNYITPSLIDGLYFYERLDKLIDFESVKFSKTIKMTRTRVFKKDPDYKIYTLSDPMFNVSHGERVLSSEVHDTGKVPVISANVFDTFGYIDRYKITDFSQDSILWGIDGNWMVNLIKKGVEFFPTDHCGVLRCSSENVKTEYLKYSLFVAGEYEMFSRWNRASDARIKALKIQIPSLATQESVVNEMDAVIKKIDDIKNKMKELNNQLIASFHAIFDQEIATNSKTRLDTLFDIQIGKTPSRSKYEYWDEGDNKWVSIADFANYDVFTSETKERITDLAVSEVNMKYVPKGTVIMSFKLTIGKTAITSEDIMTNEAIVAFLPKGNLSSIFYKYYFELYDWLHSAMNAVKGSTLNSDSINESLIIQPSDQAVSDFEKAFNEIETKKDGLRKQISSYKKDLDDLLTKHFR